MVLAGAKDKTERNSDMLPLGLTYITPPQRRWRYVYKSPTLHHMSCAVQVVREADPDADRFWLIRFHDGVPLGVIAHREGRPYGPYDDKAIGIYPADTHGWVFWCTITGESVGFRSMPPMKVTPWSDRNQSRPMVSYQSALDEVYGQARDLRCAVRKTPEGIECQPPENGKACDLIPAEPVPPVPPPAPAL